MDFQLSPPQMRFLRDQHRSALFLAGIGSGKTHVGCLWALCQSATPSVGLLGAQNPSQLNSVVIKCFAAMLDQAGINYCYGSEPPWFKSRFERHSNILSLSTGTQVLAASMHESGADRTLRGTELNWAYLDETRDMSEDVYHMVLGRMRARGGPHHVRLTSTPRGHDWAWRLFVDQPGQDRGITRATTMDNRHLPPGYAESLKSQYSSDLYRQEVLGEIVNMGTGRACPAFDRARHVSPCPFAPGLPLILGLDFNVSPMAGVVCQRQGDSLRVIDELWIQDNAQTRQLVAILAGRYASKSPEVHHVSDASGLSRNTKTLDTDAAILDAELRRAFRRVVNLQVGHNPRVVDRVNSLNTLLDPASGGTRIAIDPRCTHLCADLESVSWLPGDYGSLDKGDPMTGHIFDALGYVTHRLFPVGGGKSWGLDGSLDPVQRPVDPRGAKFPMIQPVLLPAKGVQ